MQPDDYLLIERFLAEDLDEAALAAFQARRLNTPAFDQAVRERIAMDTFLENRPRREALKAELQVEGQHFFSPPAREVTLRSRQWWPWAVAAALVAGLILSWPFLFPPASLYQQFAQHQPLSLQEKSTATTASALAAETAFNEGDYATAYEALSALVQATPGDGQAQLALGICALELGRYQEAATQFDALRQWPSAFQASASWYRALTHLQQQDTTAAIALLETIPADSFWASQSQALIEKLAN